MIVRDRFVLLLTFLFLSADISTAFSRSGLDTEPGANPVRIFSVSPADESQRKAAEEIPETARHAFLNDTNSNWVNDQSLRDFCISLDRTGKKVTMRRLIGNRHTHCMESETLVVKNIKYYPLTRPGDSNFVAILRMDDDRVPTLNPVKGFDYGPIPLLQNMSIECADQLWGPAQIVFAQAQNEVEKTYKLISKNQTRELRVYNLECTFRNGRLLGYKVSGPGIDSANWGPIDYLP